MYSVHCAGYENGQNIMHEHAQQQIRIRKYFACYLIQGKANLLNYKLQIKQTKEQAAKVLALFSVECVRQIVCKLRWKSAENKAPTHIYFLRISLLLALVSVLLVVVANLKQLSHKVCNSKFASIPRTTWYPDKTCRHNLTVVSPQLPSPLFPPSLTQRTPLPQIGVECLARGDDG